MSDQESAVLYSVDGAIAHVRLNRPEKRNALNDELISGIKNALNKTRADQTIRVILLSGEGKDFCSGADLSALQKIAVASRAGACRHADRIFDRPQDFVLAGGAGACSRRREDPRP